MATRLYSAEVGTTLVDITQASGSATTAGMELTIDLAKFTNKKAVILALEQLTAYITKNNWAPA